MMLNKMSGENQKQSHLQNIKLLSLCIQTLLTRSLPSYNALFHVLAEHIGKKTNACKRRNLLETIAYL